tara:strand:- start:17546 stop:18127 length:582 start_codon:yes stop_codon:yes gene_type:complete
MANLFDTDNAPTLEPDKIVIGDRVTWRKKNLAVDYPSSAYSTEYVSKLSTSPTSEFKVSGSADGNDYLFTIASTASVNFDNGHHHWQLEIVRTSDSERIVIQTGSWDVITDLDNNVDPRDHAEIMVDKIESLLEGKADGDVQSYSIAGRSLTKFSPEELLHWREYYRREVVNKHRLEDIKNGRATSGTIKVRF